MCSQNRSKANMKGERKRENESNPSKEESNVKIMPDVENVVSKRVEAPFAFRYSWMHGFRPKRNKKMCIYTQKPKSFCNKCSSAYATHVDLRLHIWTTTATTENGTKRRINREIKYTSNRVHQMTNSQAMFNLYESAHREYEMSGKCLSRE